MEKLFYNVMIECKHIISEPGDSTRYDYIIIKNNDNCICIMPFDSDFIYPQQLFIEDAARIKTIKDSIEFINNEIIYKNVNPYILLECARTINKLYEQ